MKKKGEQKISRPSKSKLLVILSLIIVLSAAATGVYFLISKTNEASDKVGEIDAATAALVKEKLAISENSKKITSTLGFSISYDSGLFDATGQVTDPASDSTGSGYVFGTEYTADELNEDREYSIVNIFPKEDEAEEENSVASIYKPELTVLTNIRKAYWDNRVNKPEHAGKDKLQIFIDETTAKQATDSTGSELSVSEIEKVTINGVELSKVVYTTTKKSFGYDYKYQSIYYFTVNNDRPYYVSISNAQNDPGGMVKTYESFIASLEFGDVDSSKLALAQSSLSNVLSASTDELPSGATNTVSDLDPKTLINVVAKNQIAVVRVGTITCMDLDLTLGGSVLSEIDNACSAGIGSGSIISSDGYIATNGHVAQMGPATVLLAYLQMAQTTEELANRIRHIEPYLVRTGQISPGGLDGLINGVITGNKEAINAAYGIAERVDNNDINIKAERSDYSIQLSNEPIKIKIEANNITFERSDNLVSAKFIDADFDRNSMAAKVDISALKTSDVAILKMDNAEFPAVTLGSITNIRNGDQLTALGFPAFLDNGMLTTKKSTVPSATQGNVRNILKQSNEYPFNLLLTDVPIAQGNSGGPAFDDLGFQVGLNTYSSIECPDMQCFGNGTARDIQDLKNLLQVNSIQLMTKTAITDEWNEGLKAFTNGKYKVATAKFNTVANKYRNNYLAKEMSTLSTSLIGSPSDRSSESFLSAQPKTIIIGLAGILVVIAIIGTIIFIMHKKKRANTQQSAYNQYGQTSYQQPQSQILPPVQQFNNYQQPGQYQQPVQQAPTQQPTQQVPIQQPIQPQYSPQPQVIVQPQPQPTYNQSYPSPSTQQLPNQNQQIISPNNQNASQPQIIRPNNQNGQF